MFRKLLVVLLLSATAFAHSVTITWKAPINTVVKYNVYRSLVSGGPYTLMGSATGTAFVNGGNPDNTPLIEGQQYCYVVTTVTATAESAYSNEACATIPVTAATAPTGVAAVAN